MCFSKKTKQENYILFRQPSRIEYLLVDTSKIGDIKQQALKRSFFSTFSRKYKNITARYKNPNIIKCVFLVRGGDKQFKHFILDRYSHEELQYLTKEVIDIYYHNKELSETGYKVQERWGFRGIESIPCIVLWDNNIEDLHIINITQLDYKNEVFELLQQIVKKRKNNQDLQSIAEEVNEMADNIRKNRNFSAIINNFEFHADNNQGSITINDTYQGSTDIKNSKSTTYINITNSDIDQFNSLTQELEDILDKKTQINESIKDDIIDCINGIKEDFYKNTVRENTLKSTSTNLANILKQKLKFMPNIIDLTANITEIITFLNNLIK